MATPPSDRMPATPAAPAGCKADSAANTSTIDWHGDTAVLVDAVLSVLRGLDGR